MDYLTVTQGKVPLDKFIAGVLNYANILVNKLPAVQLVVIKTGIGQQLVNV
jgi:hypothetical protein